MPIEKFTHSLLQSTAFLAVSAGSTRILGGTTNRTLEVCGYWINSLTANVVSFTADNFNPTVGGGLSGELFVGDRGGAVNAGPTGSYDVNGRLVPWFRTGTSSDLYIYLLNAGSCSGVLLYQVGT